VASSGDESAGLNFNAALKAELLTSRQRQQLRDQDLQNLQAYLGVVYEMRTAEANREIALEEYRHKMGISTEEEYARWWGRSTSAWRAKT
jgi:hypothetical protein